MKVTKSELKGMIREALREELKRAPLKEARSVADIEAEIARLQRELADAKVAEKRIALGGALPAFVWAWDMYIDPAEKGTFCSAEKYAGAWDGVVFETEDAALDAGWYHLQELDDEGELSDDPDDYIEPDDYTVDAFAIPLKDVPASVLKWSNLEHLIP
jgi:hypothetical protein